MEEMPTNENKAELSEAEKQEIKQIEELPVDINEKIDALLVKRGLKEATDITFGHEWGEGDEPQQLTNKEINLFIGDLLRTGLEITQEFLHEAQGYQKMTESKNAPYVTPGYERIRFFVAREQEKAEKLKKAHETGDYETYGKMSGYPESAVDTFTEVRKKEPYGEKMKDRMILSWDMPEEMQNKDFMAFAQLAFSKNNWKEELETVKKWAKEIKQTSPRLYKKQVKEYKENLNN